VVDNAFNPATSTVAVGGTVTWTNAGAAAHTVSFTGGPDCGRINAGASVSRTFDAAGTFAYICSFHPATMAGTITVQ
jgi:plastocyanin